MPAPLLNKRAPSGVGQLDGEHSRLQAFGTRIKAQGPGCQAGFDDDRTESGSHAPILFCDRPVVTDI
jgi:hypothetical protein